jgi:hypothetical protein
LRARTCGSAHLLQGRPPRAAGALLVVVALYASRAALQASRDSGNGSGGGAHALASAREHGRGWRGTLGDGDSAMSRHPARTDTDVAARSAAFAACVGAPSAAWAGAGAGASPAQLIQLIDRDPAAWAAHAVSVWHATASWSGLARTASEPGYSLEDAWVDAFSTAGHMGGAGASRIGGVGAGGVGSTAPDVGFDVDFFSPLVPLLLPFGAVLAFDMDARAERHGQGQAGSPASGAGAPADHGRADGSSDALAYLGDTLVQVLQRNVRYVTVSDGPGLGLLLKQHPAAAALLAATTLVISTGADGHVRVPPLVHPPFRVAALPPLADVRQLLCLFGSTQADGAGMLVVEENSLARGSPLPVPPRTRVMQAMRRAAAARGRHSFYYGPSPASVMRHTAFPVIVLPTNGSSGSVPASQAALPPEHEPWYLLTAALQLGLHPLLVHDSPPGVLPELPYLGAHHRGGAEAAHSSVRGLAWEAAAEAGTTSGQARRFVPPAPPSHPIYRPWGGAATLLHVDDFPAWLQTELPAVLQDEDAWARMRDDAATARRRYAVRRGILNQIYDFIAAGPAAQGSGLDSAPAAPPTTGSELHCQLPVHV